MAIATIYVAVVLIGIDVLSNQDLFVMLAITNPTLVGNLDQNCYPGSPAKRVD